jgi:Amt family ammonium transporter
VYFALNYLSRTPLLRRVDDTLGVIYTHGFAGLAGGLLVGIFADPQMALSYTSGPKGLTAAGTATGVIHGNWTLLKWQFFAGLWVIVWTGVVTFILLKVVNVFIPLRMKTENMEIGDVAEHGHEVYPSDVPSLAFPAGTPRLAGTPAPAAPSTM